MIMRQDTSLLVTVLIVIFITGGDSYTGGILVIVLKFWLYLTYWLCPSVILRDPETQITPAGGSKTFVCTGKGDVSWYINNQWLSSTYENELEGDGYTFSETYLSYPTVNLTMTVPATEDLNGTKIQCKTVGTDGVVVESAVAWLWIAGWYVYELPDIS